MSSPSRYFRPEDLRAAFPEFSDFRSIAENDKGAVFDCLSNRRGIRVALKLSADHGYADTRERFEREFAILFANQHHERLVRILDERGCRSVHMLDGSRLMHFFFTMMLCHGDIGKELRAGRLDLCSRIISVLQLLDGLCYLHAKGIAHRDIKPGNLFLEHVAPSHADSPAHPIAVKLGDFDIAKFSRAVEHGSHGHPVGTLYYLAPERWQDSGENSDWRPSDQYAAGVTAFQILSGGYLPMSFEGLNSDNEPYAYHQVHLSGRRLPLTIPERRGRQGSERYSRLERVLYRMMSVEPEARYGDLLKAKLALLDALTSAGLWPCPHRVSV